MLNDTFEVFKEENLNIIKNYVEEYRNWLADVLASDIDSKEAVILQSIDTVSLQVEMPDGRTTTTKIITPLHPLRLAWLINIYDQYTEWETKTQDDCRYRKPDVWYKKLDKLFYGELNPEIAPLVIVDDNKSGYMQYVGELCFGWGLYANPLQDKDDTFSTGFRQLKAYLSQLFNIGVQYRIDSDVNQVMVYRLMHKYINYACAVRSRFAYCLEQLTACFEQRIWCVSINWHNYNRFHFNISVIVSDYCSYRRKLLIFL